MQDLVLQILQNYTNPFYLTGGTALNRAYVNVRYSDDLDFFENNSPTFSDDTENAIKKLVENGFSFSENSLVVSKDFVSMMLSHENFSEKLKIDFVNDIPVYYGKQVKTPLFDKTDCIENILTNKLSALIGRSEIKDAVDIHSISKGYSFSWNDAIEKAEKKEATVDAALIAGILSEVSNDELNKIKWIKQPDFNQMIDDFNTIARDILCLSRNSLCK